MEQTVWWIILILAMSIPPLVIYKWFLNSIDEIEDYKKINNE